MELLQESCEGTIEVFSSENYGLCSECCQEGYFRITREDENSYAEFTEITCNRQLAA
jgi:hypothetical protein